MFSKISVLIPTRHRIERLKTMIDSFDRTTRGLEQSAELVFRVDEDDTASQEFLAGSNMVIGPRLRGYESMPMFFNEMAAAANGDVLLCGNDDMVFRTQWILTILAAANEYPDGLFDFGVTTHNEANYPFSIVSRKAVMHLGFIWDPRIFWGDIFLRDTMAAFGRCRMLPAVQIDHDWAGNKPDVVFEEGNWQRFMPRGSEYWSGIHLTAVNEAVAKLRALQ